MPLPLPTLLQISDSAFPTGAFAYSSGLEALARAGRFTGMAALEAHFSSLMRQAETHDLAFVAAAHAEEDEDAFGRLCDEWDATFWNPGMRTASLRQARALVELLAELFPRPGMEALRDRARNEAEGLHFALALGRALALIEADREQACWMYLHGIARDQAASAVRLGLIGPRAAQVLQARAVADSAARRAHAAEPPAPRDARRTAPLAETGQGAHGFLYSRLFQN